jgi:cysteinyl-tRNA synthetase
LAIIDVLKTFDEVFSIMNFDILEEKEEKIPENISELFEKRQNAKKEKNFKEADLLRDEILKL